MKRHLCRAALSCLAVLIVLPSLGAQEVAKTPVFTLEKIMSEKFSDAGGGHEAFCVTRKRGKDIMTLVYRKNNKEYFTVNGREYGPFENSSCRIRTTGPNRWFSAKGADSGMIMVNGEVHGPFKQVLKVNVSEKTSDWNAPVFDGEKFYLVSGARGKEGPFVSISENAVVTRDLACYAFQKKPFETFLQYNDAAFGPYRHEDTEISIRESPDGRSCAVQVENDRDNDPDENYMIVDGRSYGPYRNSYDFRFGKDGKSWGFRYTGMDDKAYAAIKGKTFGPFEGTGSILHVGGRWFYSHSPKYGEHYVRTTGSASFGPFDSVSELKTSPGGAHYWFTASVAKGKGEREYFAFIDDVRHGPFREIHGVHFSGIDDGWLIVANTSEVPGMKMAVITSTGGRMGDYEKIDRVCAGDLISNYCFSYQEKGKRGRHIWMNGPAKTLGPFEYIDQLSISRKGSIPYALATDRKGSYHVTADKTFGPFERISYIDTPELFLPLVRQKGKEYHLINGELIASPGGTQKTDSSPPISGSSLVIPDKKGVLVTVGDEKFGPYEKAFPATFSARKNNWAFPYYEKQQVFVRLKDGTVFGPYDDMTRPEGYFHITFSSDERGYMFMAGSGGKRYAQLGCNRKLGPYDHIGDIKFMGNTNHGWLIAERGENSLIVVDGKEIAGSGAKSRVINTHYLEADDGKFLYWISVTLEDGLCMNRIRIE